MSQPDGHTPTSDEAAPRASGSPADDAATGGSAGAAALPRVGDVVAGRYEVLRSLGVGATGHVFLATHTALNKQVALKVLSPKAAEEPEQAERFLREAQAASGLRHPRIVEITDFGSTDDGLPFLAMDYLPGEDLAACLARSSRLPWPRARALILEILEALSCAHANGVVHRDLKPENIFLTEGADYDPDNSVKLVDFGIAKLLTEPAAGRLTSDGRILGTPQYMSPEQAVGKHVDARSDLYAAGILLFEMLTGSLPFFEGSTMAILSQQITQAPPTLAATAPDLELDELPELEVIVARALEKDPDQRFSTAEEFADAIRAVGCTPAAPTTSARVRWLLLLGGIAALTIAAFVWAQGDGVVPGPGSAIATKPAPSAVVRPPPTVDTPSSAAAAPPPKADNAGPMVVDETEILPVEPAAAIDTEPVPGAPKKPKSRRRPQPTPHTPEAPPPDASPTVPEQVSDETATQHLQRAASRCSAFVSRGGQDLDIDVNIAADGNVYGAVVRPPYGGDHPLGRCVAKKLNGASLPVAKQGRAYRGTIRLVHAP